MTQEDNEEFSTLEKFQKAVKIASLMRQKPMQDDIIIKAQKALMKPQLNRTSEDFYAIERCMIKIKFFTRLKLKHGLIIFKEVCKYLYYKRVQPDERIININKEGKTFYVILKGSVAINIYLPKKKIGNDEEMISEESQINILESGDSFGELALLDPQSKTIANVVSKETTELACLDRVQFALTLGALNQAEIHDKMNFVRNIHFLSNWFDNDLKTLSFNFESLYFDRKEFAFREGDPCDGYIYFVKKGEVLLTRNHQNKIVGVCNLMEGEVFGEEEYLQINVRQYSANITMENTQLFRLAKVDLDLRINHPDLKAALMDSLNMRWQWRQKRFEQLQNMNSKPHLSQMECEENLKKYLCPDNDFINQMPNPKPKKISSFTISREFDFMEPTSSIQFVNWQNQVKPRKVHKQTKSAGIGQKRLPSQSSQFTNVGSNITRKSQEPSYKFKGINGQLMKNHLIHKYTKDEVKEVEQLPFNFVTQESVKFINNHPQSFYSRGSSHKTLIDEANQFAEASKPKYFRSKPQSYNNSINTQSKSFKLPHNDSIIQRFRSSGEINGQINKQSPSNALYTVTESKTSLRFKRLFPF